MATPEQYAEWIVKNQDKKGSPEFDTVSRAYKEVRGNAGTTDQIPAGLVEQIPGMTPAKPAAPSSGFPRLYTPFEVGEAALTMGTGAVANVVGAFAGVGETIRTGKIRGQESMDVAGQTRREVANALTYRPRREGAQDILDTIGKVISESKIAGLGPTEALPLATLAGPAMRQASDAVRSVHMPSRMGIFGGGEQMAGVGAAETRPAALRTERAAQLPVPINLTKGQATRTFEQQQFEREAAKNPTIGAPLRERFAEQNRQIPQNLEFFADQTGAQAGSLRATGQIVTEAIAGKAKVMKGKYDAAFTAAREAGETQAPVNVTPLRAYLDANKPQAINAGVLASTDSHLQALAKTKGGVISIDDLEEIRKAAGVAGGKDATNAHFAREIKDVIDNITEGVGGEKYKYARRLYSQYKKEFENVGIVDRLMSAKPGTVDRTIAFEDVFDRAIMGGSLDDVRAVRRTLQTAGTEGQQAWRELQGQTINHIKDEITKNSARDINGNPVVSAAQFNKIVIGLEKDGKLEFLFGKQGAQKIKDLRDISLDAMTSPPGSVNTSNTASVVLAALDTIVSGTSGLPLPIGTAINYGVRKVKDLNLQKRVSDALSGIR